VFGQIKAARGFSQFLLRGLDKVRAEWAMVCTAHILAHQPHDKAREMVGRNEIPHRWGQQQVLVDVPVAKALAHATLNHIAKPAAIKTGDFSDRLLD
jgi:hypothetical protein